MESKSELKIAKRYLKYSGLTFVPDTLKEHLKLKQSAATLGRKFRSASTGDNPELLRSYYTNQQGRKIVEFRWNPNYKEASCSTR